MEWYYVILLFFVLLMAFVFFGFPIAFAFFTVNIILTTVFVGFTSGIGNLVHSAFDSLTKFSLTPVPLFILMGEVLFHSGVVMRTLDGFSKWLGKVPSRISILAIATGTMFSALSGSAVANAAMLGSSLTPEMMRQGYHIKMIVGPILAAGGLAMIIPPSAMAILLGSLGRISVGDLLIAGIIPGLIIALMLIIYYMIIGFLKPSLAPTYNVETLSMRKKLRILCVDILPAVLLIFIVLGLIFSGYATPTESAAIGALGAIILPAFYGKLTKDVILKTINGTVKISSMILLILAASGGFSQLLAYTGATRGLVNTVLNLDMLPILTIILMLVVVFILGLFIEPISILMITVPLYIPVVAALEYDLVWFGIVLLICLGIGNFTPPFGMLLFVMRGVVPDSVRIKDIYKAVISIVVIHIVAVILMLIFPEIITWLPSLGKTAQSG